MRARKGQALVEFALVLPILLLLMAAIMEFGRAWNIKQVMTSTSAAAARTAAVADSTVADSSVVKPMIRKRLAAAGLDSLKANLSGVGLRLTTGTSDTVWIRYGYRFKMMGAFVHWATGTDSVTLSGRTIMRNE